MCNSIYSTFVFLRMYAILKQVQNKFGSGAIFVVYILLSYNYIASSVNSVSEVYRIIYPSQSI